jgi:hypothetical protein
MTERHLDQLFLRPSGGGLEVLMVFESLAGARTRERLPLSVRDPERAVGMIARHLAQRPERTSVTGVRLRVERGGELRDDRKLAARLVAALRREELD